MVLIVKTVMVIHFGIGMANMLFLVAYLVVQDIIVGQSIMTIGILTLVIPIIMIMVAQVTAVARIAPILPVKILKCVIKGLRLQSLKSNMALSVVENVLAPIVDSAAILVVIWVKNMVAVIQDHDILLRKVASEVQVYFQKHPVKLLVQRLPKGHQDFLVIPEAAIHGVVSLEVENSC